MKKISVQVKSDHIEFLSRAKPMTAVAELVWNALDAEATEVRVEFVENDLGGIECLRVRDNGHGLLYDHALVVFRNLGGSWKREGAPTARRKREMHGKYGKGRFRAFTLGNRVEWRSVFELSGITYAYSIVGHGATPGEFDLSDPEPTPSAPVGMAVEIADLPAAAELLRGVKALQEATDIFALYLRQYPDTRIVYDGVPLDPRSAEDHCAEYELGEIVTQDGQRVHAALTVVEWNLPGKRGVLLCDAAGFALHASSLRPYFRGFSYTAYLKSDHVAALEREGLLPVHDLSPDVGQLLDAARVALRQHFSLREAERSRDALTQWRDSGIYPYEGEPANRDEEAVRRIFDIYAVQLSRLPDFAETGSRAKRLILQLLRQLIEAEPVRAARVLDRMVSLSREASEAIEALLEEEQPIA
ncbi:MAG TPA: ATP-binding protein [Candidatus Hydrogenedentes bacterium]|nr:ATP-binding protein [Candidatus Hydrogenedentota bacterium]HOS01748.1 ATP-binding protein [Candidatus Hydrogenedentota bacterium]